jgi:hypothetical protein
MQTGDSITVVAREQLYGHVSLATREAIMEAVFSVWSIPRLHNQDQLLLRESPDTAVRSVGGWCEMAASLREREPGSRGTSTVGRRYQAAQ